MLGMAIIGCGPVGICFGIWHSMVKAIDSFAAAEMVGNMLYDVWHSMLDIG
jgi:hypothetical protein